MIPLLVAVLAWLGLHVVVPATVRSPLIARLGQERYIPLFAMSSLAALVAMILGYRVAPYVPLWMPPPGAGLIVPALVGAGFLLVALGVSAFKPPPAASEIVPATIPKVVGIIRISRHPFLAGTALWAVAHLLVNGHVAALLLFGSLLLTALCGMTAIDRRRQVALGPVWNDFARQTSRLPFAAIVGGRNQLRVDEIPWKPAVIGISLFLGVHLSHAWVFGVPPYLP